MSSEVRASETIPSQIVRDELELLRGSVPEAAWRTLADHCDGLCAALDEGLPLRYLGSCATVSDEGALRLSSSQQQRRVGPFPFFTRGVDWVGIDDYTCDEPALLVGAKGAIARGSGKLLVLEVSGRYSHSDNYLRVTTDALDLAYLRETLNTLDAQRYANGSQAARVIEAAALKAAFIPWPTKPVRDQFVSAVAQCEALGAEPLERAIQQAWLDATHHVQLIEKPEAPREVDNSLEASSEQPPAVPDQAEEGFFELVDRLVDLLATPTDTVLDVVAATPSLESPAVPAQADFCVCFPGFLDEPWTEETVDPQDTRWVYGAPPKNKPHFAWIQQTAACMNDSGRALLLMRDAVLHSNLGREKDIREAWAASNTIEAVIALPGGIFPDGRPPASIIVLNKSRAGSAETLFINALDGGLPLGTFPDGARERLLPEETIERILDAYRCWLENTDYRNQPGFCHSASQEDIARHQGNLSPWLYTEAQE